MINPFKKPYTPQEEALFKFLSTVKMFELLTPEEMNLFLPFLFLRKYKEREVVFFRNDPSHAFYIVKSGKVSLNIDIKEKFETLTQLSLSRSRAATFSRYSIMICLRSTRPPKWSTYIRDEHECIVYCLVSGVYYLKSTTSIPLINLIPDFSGFFIFLLRKGFIQ